MLDSNETTDLLYDTNAIDPTGVLGPSDKAFRGSGISVIYRFAQPGLFGSYRCLNAKFTIVLGSAFGIFQNRKTSGWSKEHQIAEGFAVCTPPNVEHRGRWERGGETLEIYVTRRFLQRLARKNVDALIKRESIPDASRDPAIRELASAICFLCAETESESSLILGNAALIIKRLVLSHAFPCDTSAGKRLSEDRRQRMETFIDANLTKRFRAPALARAVGLSPQQFTPLCRATTGKSPMDYVWERRLLKVRELANTGKYSRSELVRLCCFSDLSHLNRRFKAYFRFPLRVLLESANGSRQS